MNKAELDKEAEEYAEKHAFRVPYDGSNKFYDDVDFKASKEGYIAGAESREKRIEELEKENAELKVKIGLSIDCEKAQKDGEFCLGYDGDEDEPCEQCKNCIKCECGYYQLGETDKDEQLTKAKVIVKEYMFCTKGLFEEVYPELIKKAEQFLNSEV